MTRLVNHLGLLPVNIYIRPAPTPTAVPACASQYSEMHPFPFYTRQPKIPTSAKAKYLPLARLSAGVDGFVILAAPRSNPPTISNVVALKLFRPEVGCSVPRRLLEELITMQDRYKDKHLIAAVHDYPPATNWIAMAYVPGRSISELMKMQYKDVGMPPCLVFHLFAELVTAQAYLKEHGLCHADLNEGGNVMLSAKEGHTWPSVTLVDYGGMQLHDEIMAIDHTMWLLQKTVNRQVRVGACWRREQFDQDDLERADMLYGLVCMYDSSNGEGKNMTLERLWKKCDWIAELRIEKLRDEIALVDLEKELNGARWTEEDIGVLAEGGGMAIEEVDG